MEFKLNKKIINPIIIQGFPGFGLVGSVATEYLIEFLKAEYVGRFCSEKLPPVAAVHNNSIVMPLGIYYSKKYNLLIVHGVSGVQGLEWEIAKTIIDLSVKTKAKEIIALESVGSQDSKSNTMYYFSNVKTSIKKFESLKLSNLKEGVIMGVTGTLMVESRMNPNFSAIFAETHTQLPDSMAASKVLEVLNNYLKLKMNLSKLKQAAQKFEDKLKGLISAQAQTFEQSDEKHLSYMG